MVLCQKNINKLGIGALFSIKNCANCECFDGIVSYQEILPRIVCVRVQTSNAQSLKMLQSYTSCKKFDKTVNCEKFCKICAFFKGVETRTGYVKCSYIKKPKERLASPLPQHMLLKVHFPHPIPCAKGGIVTIDSCLSCQYFKGIYSRSLHGKICCTHPDAMKSEYLTFQTKSSLPKIEKKPFPKYQKLPNLRWLFEGKIKTHNIKIKVGCILDKTLKRCQEDCVDHKGIQNFHVNCATFRSPPIYVIKCPHTHLTNLLSNCFRCSHFEEIRNGSVRCSYTKLQNYVNKSPKVGKKPKYYYDFGD
jgi:hypothetical protein